jgi:hypothetical protein
VVLPADHIHPGRPRGRARAGLASGPRPADAPRDSHHRSALGGRVRRGHARLHPARHARHPRLHGLLLADPRRLLSVAATEARRRALGLGSGPRALQRPDGPPLSLAAPTGAGIVGLAALATQPLRALVLLGLRRGAAAVAQQFR